MILTEFEIKRAIRKINQGEISPIKSLDEIRVDDSLLVFSERSFNNETGSFTEVYVSGIRKTEEGIKIVKGEFRRGIYEMLNRFRLGYHTKGKFNFKKKFMILEFYREKDIYRIEV